MLIEQTFVEERAVWLNERDIDANAGQLKSQSL